MSRFLIQTGFRPRIHRRRCRVGAPADLSAEAAEAEVEAFIAAAADLVEAAGRRRVIRHGCMPEREAQSGLGAVAVRRPRVRDRALGAEGAFDVFLEA